MTEHDPICPGCGRVVRALREPGYERNWCERCAPHSVEEEERLEQERSAS